MMQILLLLLIVYAACGLIVSLVAHILSLLGIQLIGDQLFWALHVGIFPLWIPVVFITRKMMGSGVQRKDVWRMALSGCPAWMKYMTYGFFIYAFVNFVIFTAGSALHPLPEQSGANALRGFSGHWMVFYSAGLAVLTTAYRRGLSNLERRCPFGHEVGWSDRFCPTCGASIAAAQGET